jgi:hypothetical protein
VQRNFHPAIDARWSFCGLPRCGAGNFACRRLSGGALAARHAGPFPFETTVIFRSYSNCRSAMLAEELDPSTSSV